MNHMARTLALPAGMFLLAPAAVMASGTGGAAAEGPATYDPLAVEYIKGLVSEPGITERSKAVGNETWTVTTDVRAVSPGAYRVATTAAFGGEPQRVEYEVRANEDGTYRVIIGDIGSDETYTDVAEVSGGGRGSSDRYEASITLHDREYGPIGTRLSDSYTACNDRTHARFSAEVLNDGRVVVSWVSHPYYLHLCIIPFGFTHVNVSDGTWERYTDKVGHHTFVGPHGATTWYIISANFYYEWF